MGSSRRWFLEIIEAEGKCSGFFGTTSMQHGTQVWDQIALPISLQMHTERQILAELNDLGLQFMEKRA